MGDSSSANATNVGVPAAASDDGTVAASRRGVGVELRKDVPVERPDCPERSANVISRLFLGWVFGLVYKGYKSPLSDENMWELRPEERGEYTTNQLIAQYNALEGHTSKRHVLGRLTSALFRNHLRVFVLTFVLKAFTVAVGALQIVFVNQILRFIESPDRPIGQGIAWAFSLLAAPLLFTIAENHYFLSAMRTGMRIRSALQGIVYDKSLTMSPSARAGSSLGEIVNLMQLDSQRIGDCVQMIHILWAAPVQLVLYVALLFNYIGVAAVVGLLFTMLTLPLQGWLMSFMAKLRARSVGITDRRVKLMNEILQGIKAVKFYAWEAPFSKAVEKERTQEVRNFSKTIWARSVFMSIMIAIPSLIAVVTFSFYVAVFKQDLNAARIFTGFALLNNLRQPVMMLPVVVNMLIDARLGIKRIERFLRLENTEDYARSDKATSHSTENAEDDTSTDPSDNSPLPGLAVEKDDSAEEVSSEDLKGKEVHQRGNISIRGGSFAWGEPGPPLTDPEEVRSQRDLLKKCLPGKKAKRTENLKEDTSSAAEAVPGAETGGEVVEAASDEQAPAKRRGAAIVLRGINLALKPGELVAVVGRVGAGKSSLVHAILGEMQKVSGEVKVSGSISYVAQTAWIFNSTLQGNVLFGREFDAKRYREAVRVSALGPDIEVLPAGDMTAIGEKGINLSGGQKQRVSIARAVYADSDMYLFDDPLSALDAHVGQSVFDRCLSKKGVLRKKLRLLVTNQIHVLPDCDRIIFLEKGTVKSVGTYRELAASEPAFKQLIDEQQRDEEEKKSQAKSVSKDVNGAVSHASSVIEESKSKALSATSTKTIGGTDNMNEVQAGAILMQSEERKTGNVNFRTYYQYAVACGGVFMFSMLLLFWCATVALQVVTSWWLAYWAEESGGGQAVRLGFFIGIYFALAIGYALVLAVRSVWYLTLALYASKRLHNKMLHSVLHAPMSFFDTTPIGRVISRFSRDVDAVDQLLPQFFSQMLTTVLSLIAAYIFNATVFPPFLAVAAPVTIGYFLLQRFFNRTSLEVKRLDSISKSPIYAHFSETLGGLSTLRAYDKQDEFRANNMKMIDINQRAFFAYIAANRWFSLYLEMLGSTLIFATAMFGVFSRPPPGELSVGADVGLALTYALQVTSILGFSVRSITELEAQMNSIERLSHYASELPQEAPSVVDHRTLEEDQRPPPNWPSNGEIYFDDIQMRYRDGLPLVLKGVSIHIKGGEKVGVVGRTGSGKSSMMIALLRLVELSQGAIKIDGIDLKNLGLDEVRRAITIIPQDSVLFSGTVRFNLDPFGQYSEPELWDALTKSHLKDFVQDFEGGLDAAVSEYGENLSAGQRQLICLTRALLRKSKVLVLDEASSSLDMETDRMIQETIRVHLKDATILTIAHRLFTLADYDKVLVMDDGKIAEYGSPRELLENSNGPFTSFVNSLGEGGAQRFRQIVENSTA